MGEFSKKLQTVCVDFQKAMVAEGNYAGIFLEIGEGLRGFPKNNIGDGLREFPKQNIGGRKLRRNFLAMLRKFVWMF